jgi:hypothetical protein
MTMLVIFYLSNLQGGQGLIGSSCNTASLAAVLFNRLQIGQSGYQKISSKIVCQGRPTKSAPYFQELAERPSGTSELMSGVVV